MQLRALDWNMDGPFRNYAAVQVFHAEPNQVCGVCFFVETAAHFFNTKGRSFATVGFPGFMGALSGMNDQKLAISEIGVSYPDPSYGKESRVGVPFIFMLREILQFDSTLAQAAARMRNKRSETTRLLCWLPLFDNCAKERAI